MGIRGLPQSHGARIVTLPEWRQARDLTTRELSALIDVRPSVLSDLEHGRIYLAAGDSLWTRLAILDGVRTEADFFGMAQESKAKAIEREAASKGPGYAFAEYTDGRCELKPTMDGKVMQ